MCPNRNYISWWHCFLTWKHEKWRSTISPSKQSHCQAMVQTTVLCIFLPFILLVAVLILLSCSGALLSLWIWHRHCVLHCEWCKRQFEIQFEHQDRDTSVEIKFQTISECGLDPIWKNCISCCLLPSRISEINVDAIWIWQKAGYSWIWLHESSLILRQFYRGWWITSVVTDCEGQSGVYTRPVVLHAKWPVVQCLRCPQHPDPKTSVWEFFLSWHS